MYFAVHPASHLVMETDETLHWRHTGFPMDPFCLRIHYPAIGVTQSAVSGQADSVDRPGLAGRLRPRFSPPHA